MKQLLLISDVKARQELQCLPNHYNVIMQRNSLILLSNPPHGGKIQELITGPAADPTPDPLAPLLSTSRDGDHCKRSELTVLMVQTHLQECKGLSAAPHLNTGAMPQTLTQVGPCSADVQVRVCTLQSYICKNANKKNGGLGLLKVSAACSKPNSRDD